MLHYEVLLAGGASKAAKKNEAIIEWDGETYARP